MLKSAVAFPVISLLVLAACDAQRVASGAEPIALEPLPDGELTGTPVGGEATLVVQDGEPVAYTFVDSDGETYTASRISRLNTGDIRIDAGRITDVQVDGGTVTGTFRLSGQSNPIELSL